MNQETRQAMEAILFVVDEPVDVSTLSQVLEVGRSEVEDELERLADELTEQRRGFVLRRVAGGWRLYTAAAAAPYVERWVVRGERSRLSQAALETLAVVAYKQPVTRQEVSDIRGVNADGVIRTLLSRGFIQEVGRDSGPGQAILHGTTDHFLEQLGIDSLDELPPLSRFFPEGPAPDEPAVGDLRAARDRLRRGRQLAATGAPTWQSEDSDTNEEAAVPTRGARRQRDDEMEELSQALEDAARNAMASLEEAVHHERPSRDQDGTDRDNVNDHGDDPQHEDADRSGDQG